MKTWLLFLLAQLLMGPTLRAEDKQRLPDLSKAFPGGKIINKPDPEILVGYRYEFEREIAFEKLKETLRAYLGEGWQEKDVNPQMSAMLKRVMKVQGVDLAGHVTFVNPEAPGREISLTQKREQRDGRISSVVDLSGNWNRTTE